MENEIQVGEKKKMDDAKIDSFIIANAKCLPAEKIALIRDKMKGLDDSRFVVVSSVEMKNPVMMLLISIFLGGFGIDRFLLGKIGSGIAKLLLGWFTFGVWWLVDVILVTKMTKEYNYNNLCQVL